MQREESNPKNTQKHPKFSFLSKEDNFSIAKYYSNLSESQPKRKQTQSPEKTENHFFSIFKKNTRSDSIPQNFTKMYYPKDQGLYRDYQFNIVKTCLLENTLVCLPTGMGKTFIASLIMFNFNLWFNGKIFFFAPTKPLVNQQKLAFTRLFESLADAVCEVNGTLSAKKRCEFYSEKKIFFMTPQVFENDFNKNEFLNSGEISLMIFDEAHKAQKKYAYSNIINLIEASANTKCYRVIGLSASPGASANSIQSTLENLKLKKIEIRTEQDADLKDYLFHKKIELVEVDNTNDINKFLEILIALIKNRLDVLKRFKIIPGGESAKYLGTCHLLKYQNEFKLKKDEFLNEIGPDMVREAHNIFSIIFRLLNAKKLLLTQGLESFKESIRKFENSEFEGKSNFKFSNNCYNNNNNFNNAFNHSSCGNNFNIRRNTFGYSNNYRNTSCESHNFNNTFNNYNFNNNFNNRKYVSPISLAKKRFIESEDFKKLKRELFLENEENVNLQKSKVNNNNLLNNSNTNNYSGSTLHSRNLKNSLKHNQQLINSNGNSTSSDFCIEIEVEKKDYLSNPFYNLFNNYKSHFEKIALSNKTLINESTDDLDLENLSNSEFYNSIINNSFTDNHQKHINNRLFSLGGEAHPKLKKLESLLLAESEAFKSGSKAIIFTQYIDSASEIKLYLEKNGLFSKNEISFEIFKGQGKGYSQISQAETLRNFKDGIVNVLIATCVAEEGIDIEDVDLIICYDIISSSPIKMIQRFGRTGRKKDGKVVVLCSKGEEKYKFFRAIKRLKEIQRDLKALKFQFEAVRQKVPQEIRNVLYVDPLVVDECEFFELQKDIIDKASEDDLLSETSEEFEQFMLYENNNNSEDESEQEDNYSEQNNNGKNNNKENKEFWDVNCDGYGEDDEVFDFNKKGFVKRKEIAAAGKLKQKQQELEVDEEAEELIVLSSDDEKNYYIKKMREDELNVFPKQNNNADLYLVENAMQMLKEKYIKRESNSSDLPNISNIENDHQQAFKDKSYFSEDELIDINEQNEKNKKELCANENPNSNNQLIIKEEEIEQQASETLIKNEDKNINKSIVKFKIFKRKSSDGRKFLTSNDLAINNDEYSFRNKHNQNIIKGEEVQKFKAPLPIKGMKENKLLVPSQQKLNNNCKGLKENNLSCYLNKANCSIPNNNQNKSKYEGNNIVNRDNKINYKNTKIVDSFQDKNKKLNQFSINSFFKNKAANPFLNQNQFTTKRTEESNNSEILESNKIKNGNLKDLDKDPFLELTDSQIMDIVKEVVKEDETETKISSLLEDKKTNSINNNIVDKSSMFFGESDDLFIDLTNLPEQNKTLVDYGLKDKKQKKSSNKKIRRTIFDESIDDLIRQNKTFFEIKDRRINKTISNQSLENLMEQNETFFNFNYKNKQEKQNISKTISDDSVMNVVNDNKTFFQLRDQKNETNCFINNESQGNPIIRSNEKLLDKSNKKPLIDISNSKANKKENFIQSLGDKNIENYFSSYLKTEEKEKEKENKNMNLMLSFHTNLKQIGNKNLFKKVNDENNPKIYDKSDNNFFLNKKEFTECKVKNITEEHDKVFEKNIADKYKIGSKRKHSDILMTSNKKDNANYRIRTIDAFFVPKKMKK